VQLKKLLKKQLESVCCQLLEVDDGFNCFYAVAWRTDWQTAYTVLCVCVVLCITWQKRKKLPHIYIL